MALRAHPTILGGLTHKQAFKSNTSILHASPSDVLTLTLQYWITTSSILPTLTQDSQEASYDVFYFTPFSTKAAWTRLYTNQPASNTISTRLTEMSPPTFPSLDLSMSTSPTPTTPPSHNSPSKAPVDPTTAFIPMMHQTLQKNATMMVHMQTQNSPPSSQQTPTAPQYKPHCPPFPK